MSQNNYPSTQETIQILLRAAAKAAEEANLNHPEDIAMVMMNAIEAGWPVLQACWAEWGKGS